MYVNNIEPEMFLPPGSESFNHNATRTTSSRSRSNNVNNNIVPVYIKSLKLQNENGNSMHSFIFVSHQTCRPQNVKVIHSQVIMSAKLQRV